MTTRVWVKHREVRVCVHDIMVCYDLEAILARVKISAHRVYSDMYSVQCTVRSAYSMSGVRVSVSCGLNIGWRPRGSETSDK